MNDSSSDGAPLESPSRLTALCFAVQTRYNLDPRPRFPRTNLQDRLEGTELTNINQVQMQGQDPSAAVGVAFSLDAN